MFTRIYNDLLKIWGPSYMYRGKTSLNLQVCIIRLDMPVIKKIQGLERRFSRKICPYPPSILLKAVGLLTGTKPDELNSEGIYDKRRPRSGVGL